MTALVMTMLQLRCTLFDINHAGRLAAHLGAERTLQQLRQAYWWPGMRCDVTLWCQECAVCATSKTPPHRPHGNLQKIKIKKSLWIWWPLIYYQAFP